jgi:hypothetical protein
MAMHLGSVALVHAVGLRLLHSAWAAFAAALLFGVSSIAFTPLHWSSGIVELMVTLLALAAFATWLEARRRGSAVWHGASAALVLAALLSKESAILYPLVPLVAHFRLGERGSALALAAPLAVCGGYAAAFAATLSRVHYVGSVAYAMTASPLFLAFNLATYLAWLAQPWVPLRDALATVHPELWGAGLAVALAVAVALWTQRGAPRHPEEVGAAWFLAFLLPVVPLAHHTYLYYLYLPLPGMCWLIAGAGLRLTRGLTARRTALAGAWATGLAVTLAAVVAIELVATRARERALVRDTAFPADKTMREALLLRNAITDLRRTPLPPGTRIAFVNPAPRRHFAVADTARRGDRPIGSYLPLEGALRHGEAVRLFFPGVEYLGFRDSLPRDWEDAEVFLYQDEGTVRHVGKGAQALAELGYFLLKARDWPRCEAMFLRSLALGEPLPDATFGLIITRDFLGDPAGSAIYAREFLRRWPSDPRAATVAQGLAQAGPPARPWR